MISSIGLKNLHCWKVWSKRKKGMMGAPLKVDTISGSGSPVAKDQAGECYTRHGQMQRMGSG